MRDDGDPRSRHHSGSGQLDVGLVYFQEQLPAVAYACRVVINVVHFAFAWVHSVLAQRFSNRSEQAGEERVRKGFADDRLQIHFLGHSW